MEVEILVQCLVSNKCSVFTIIIIIILPSLMPSAMSILIALVFILIVPKFRSI